MFVGAQRQLAAVAIVLALVLGAVLGLVYPDRLSGVGGWSIVVAGVLYGYGSVVRRLLKLEVALGEQLLLGAAAWTFTSGLLLAIGVASRLPLFVLAGAGVLLAIHEIWSRSFDPPATRAPKGERLAHALLWVFLTGFFVINLLAMTAGRGNPYDDQLGYLAFVKRVLDCGDLIEPFSFRRVSAYGGQTMLQALAALRGDVAAIDLLDRGIFQWISALVLLDLCRRRALHIGMQVALLAFLFTLWDMNLNSAAIWTGFAAFVGAYSFASREDLEPRVSMLVTFGLCAFACTLRQNYLLPAGLFALLIAIFHLRGRKQELSSWKAAWTAERMTIALSVAVAAAIVLPYLVATFRACGTFLYPVFLGTGNPTMPLRPTGGTVLGELEFFVQVAFSSEPIKIWWVLVPLMLVVKDTRARKPWPALLIACAIGFLFMIHSFLLSDSYNLWRYGFAYMTGMVMVFFIEVATRVPLGKPSTSPGFGLPMVAVFLVWVALVAHFVESRSWMIKRFQNTAQDFETALDLGTIKYDPRVEGIPDLQRTVPEGEKIAALIDDPWVLDYRRNRIFNLDLPGVSATGSGLPSFTTPEHWRSYFTHEGIRYLIFAEDGQSTWLYRRLGWVWRIYGDDELYRYIAAHMVDTIDAFNALAKTSRVLGHHDGMYMIDLGENVPPEGERGAPELVRMDEYIRKLSETELQSKAWSLTSRRNVVFQSDLAGPSRIVELPGLDPLGPPPRGLWALMFGDSEHGAFRWMVDRTRVRVKGEGTNDLHVKIWVRKRRIGTMPTISVFLDGTRIAKAQLDKDNNVIFDTPVQCTGWCDLYIVISTVSEWWLASDDIRVAKMLEFEWTPRP